MFTHLDEETLDILLCHWTLDKTYPKDQSGILPMPAVADMMGKETPHVLVVLPLHQDPHTCARFNMLVSHVLLPDDRQKQWTRRVHDRDVGQ